MVVLVFTFIPAGFNVETPKAFGHECDDGESFTSPHSAPAQDSLS